MLWGLVPERRRAGRRQSGLAGPSPWQSCSTARKGHQSLAECGSGSASKRHRSVCLSERTCTAGLDPVLLRARRRYWPTRLAATRRLAGGGHVCTSRRRSCRRSPAGAGSRAPGPTHRGRSAAGAHGRRRRRQRRSRSRSRGRSRWRSRSTSTSRSTSRRKDRGKTRWGGLQQGRVTQFKLASPHVLGSSGSRVACGANPYSIV